MHNILGICQGCNPVNWDSHAPNIRYYPVFPADSAEYISLAIMKPLLRSLWRITYGGPQHGVMLRKLERLAQFKAIDPFVERLYWNGQKLAFASFFIEHTESNIDEIHISLLRLAWKLSPTWRITMQGKDLSGEWSEDAVGKNLQFEQIVSSCQIIKWSFEESQKYQYPSYLLGQANHW